MFSTMDAFANELIDAFGGTSATAALAHTGVSTVHHWRKKGLSPSRLDHLRRIAQHDVPSVDVGAIAAKHGVDLPSKASTPGTSSGTSLDVSQQVAA